MAQRVPTWITRPAEYADRRVPKPEDLASPAHSTALVARLGRWLGIAFLVCFATGLISYNAKEPDGLLLSGNPWWGYRLNQGIHVAAGICCLPLLLAKVYSAYPKFFERPHPPSTPGVQGLARAAAGFVAEKGLTAILVAAAIMQVTTGLFNIFQWYAFKFDFVAVHWAVGWVATGALVVHVAVKLPIIKQVFARGVRRPDGVDVSASVPGRRGFLTAVLGTAAGLTVLTVGQSLSALDRIALLAPRRPRSHNVQGVPVNVTAEQAGVSDQLNDWQLTVVGPDGERVITREQLADLPRAEVRLPIACVEGWSVNADWAGVRVRDLMALVGGQQADLRVSSMQRGARLAVTRMPAAFTDHPDTLLATELNGEQLDPDHGFPARIIAPNRPGELQTKWVERLEAL